MGSTRCGALCSVWRSMGQHCGGTVKNKQRIRLWALGGAVAAMTAGCAAETPAKTTEEKAQFNYVPLNDEACVLPADDAGKIAVATKLGSLASHYTSGAASEFKVCDTCADDKLGALLKAVNKDVTIGGATVSPPFLDLVNKSLAYPYRELLLSWATEDNGDTSVVLGQGVVAGDPAAHAYFVNPETLDKACKDFANVISSTAKETLDADGKLDTLAITNAEPGAGSFGFIVPTALPDLTLPAEEIAEQLGHTPGLNIRIGKPEVKLDVDANGDGAGTISGWIEPGQFQAFADAGIDLKPFIDEASGSIQAVLSFKVARASLTSAVDVNTLRTAPADADDTTTTKTSPLTSDHPLPAPDSTGIIADCSDCDSDINRAFYYLPGKPAIKVPLDILRIAGTGEKFTVQIMDKAGKPMVGWFPQILGTNLQGGVVRVAAGTTVATAKAAGKAQFDFSRSFRPGGSVPRRPPCADLLTAKKPLTFSPREGWVQVAWRPTDGKRSGAAHWVFVCQDYSAKKCPEHSGINLDGSCECEAGYERAFDKCLDKKLYNCPAEGHLALEPKTKAISCTCPTGTVHEAANGGKCVANQCSETSCKADEMCVQTKLAGKIGIKCAPGDVGYLSLKTMAKTPTALAKIYDTLLKAKKGKTDEADGIEELDDDHDGGGTVGDDPDEKLDTPSKGGGKQKAPLSHVHSAVFVGAKGRLNLGADMKRIINGKYFPHAARVEKVRSFRADLFDITMYVSTASYGKVMNALKAGTLPSTVNMEISEFRHNRITGKYFLAYHNGNPTAYKINNLYVEKKSKGGLHLVRVVMSSAHAEQMREITQAAAAGKIKQRVHK